MSVSALDRAPALPMAPQPLQPLSPERVNGTRPSTASTSQKSPSKGSTGDKGTRHDLPSPFSSPTRKAANLFADYNPNRVAMAKESGFVLQASPTIGDINAFKSHVRTNSDVQGLVKRFEHLDVRDRDAESNERRKKLEAELRRAQIAREEAESDAKKLREESRKLKREVEEGKDRERRVGKRLEVVMEEYTNFKESHASQSSIYEKEVRKARKEAFKSSSAVVKLQEELKGARSTLRVAQSTLDMEKRKTQQRDQETFDAQYKLASMQEELEQLQTRLRVAEEEREALKRNLQEEEVARIAAEGRIALPVSPQGDDELLLRSPVKRSPQKRPFQTPGDDDKENSGVLTKKTLEIRSLLQDLAAERRSREQAEEMTEFLRLECQFRCCSCVTSSEDAHGDLSNSFVEDLALIRQVAEDVLAPVIETPEVEMVDAVEPAAHETRRNDRLLMATSTEVEMSVTPNEVQQDEPDLSCTIRADTVEPISMRRSRSPITSKAATEEQLDISENDLVDSVHQNDSFRASTPHEVTLQVPLRDADRSARSSPTLETTPYRPEPSIRTVTTTTTIPMQFTPAKRAEAPARTYNFHPESNTAASSPVDTPIDSAVATAEPAFDRAAALAAIAYRRGRAKSIADGQTTPRKQMLEGVINLKERRDISAPLLGQKVGGKNTAAAAKGSASVGKATGRKSPFA